MSRRADAVSFGLDFQVNAAIILMLENINDLEYIRLEAPEEDIAIKLNNGKYILAQAKSHIHGSYDNSNVLRDLRKSLVTLSEGSHMVTADKLILITNSFDPLKDTAAQPAFFGGGKRDFSDLPPSSQKKIEGYLATIAAPLDPRLLRIQVIQFETGDYDERYKQILSAVKDFTGQLSNNNNLPIQLMDIWRRDLFMNGSIHDSDIKLSKKELIWPIIVIITDIESMADDLQDRLDMDDGEYEEVSSRYRNFINQKCEKYDSFTKVLYDYHTFISDRKISHNEKMKTFIERCWGNYVSEFSLPSLEPDLQEYLVKIILYTILRRRYEIERIKKAVNL